MGGIFDKLAYSAVVLLLAIFVAMPPQPKAVTVAEVTVAPPSTESRLAKAIHARIAVEVTGEAPAARLNQLAAEEDGLRALAFASNADGAREQVIDYLADELSAVMLQRSAITTQTAAASAEREKMEEIVRALTTAINNEVRGVSV